MKAQTIDKRSEVLTTALELFVKQGLQQTSMAQISKESGVAVGTMYHHFSSKDVLINGLFLEIEQNLGNAVQFSDVEKQLSIKKRFEILWRKAYNFYDHNPQQFIFQDTHNYSPLISNETREIARENYTDAIAFIQEAIDKNVFIKTDILILIRWYYNSVVTLIQIKLSQEVEITEDMINTAIKMTWNSMSNN
ncbi:TetR/AcrR family transcriptional regulator [Algibacter sp. 2305UL17-15]|uniref:TetR/AcrR family transcriptional regulator n=1 Tax=Algibacter sp. 2305UL17-15 TaxID=3231268 RepID=UPI0034577EB5